MADSDLAPVAEDLSAYVLGGRSTDASLGISHAVEAERLGFRRVWISERYNMKEAGVLMGAIAARTTRLGVGTGAMTITARPPIVTAALGLSIHSAFGPRCVLGLGLGTVEFNRPHGMAVASYAALVDYADIIKRLYRGEEVDYEGPAGSYSGLFFPDLYDGPQPEVWHVQMGGPKAAKVPANPAFDGVMFCPYMTPEATHRSVLRIREECERIGRDPGTLRICAPVPTAPEVVELEIVGDPAMANPTYGDGPVTADSLKAFAAIFFQQPTAAVPFVRRNGWKEETRQQIEHHPLFRGMEDVTADYQFRDRKNLIEAGQLVPDSWIRESCAVGSASECVKKLQEFRDAGADEVAIYCSTPAQNKGVIAAWRDRPEAASSARLRRHPSIDC